MADLFSNPLVVAENIVGSLLDTRAVILWEQPAVDASQFLSANSLLNAVAPSVSNIINSIIQTTALTELFTGFGIKYLSDINGWNAYGISYVSAKVNTTSDICEHPTESGSKISDYAILNPVEATIVIALPTAFYSRIMAQLKSYYLQKKPIILQTKLGFYENMVISAMPYTLEASSVDRPQIELTLRQIFEVVPQYVENSNVKVPNPIDGQDSDTKDLGQVQSTESTFESLSALGLS